VTEVHGAPSFSIEEMVGGTHESDRSVANRACGAARRQPSKEAWDMIAALGDSELATLAAYVPRVVGDGSAWRELATRLEPLLIELLEYAARALDPAQFALRRWMDGTGFAELTVELGLAGPRDADKLVRAALARLRRHFGDENDG
jgi:hypothetical protein